MQKHPENRKMWSGVWGYRESYAIVAGLFVAGIFLGYFLNKETYAIQWPYNIISGLTLVLILLIIGILFRNSNIFRWLSGKKNAICSISYYLVLIILLGLIPQKQIYSHDLLYRLGFTHLLSSHFFLFANLYLLISLGAVIIRRFNNFSLRNIAFFFNHFGLWLTLFSIGLGAGDLKKVRLDINNIDPSYEGVYENGQPTGDLGIAIQLQKFDIDFYPPKAFIINAVTGNIINNKEFVYLSKDKSGIIGEWNIKVENFIDYAISVKDEFHAVYETGAAPAAYILATNNSGETKEGWISCGSFRFRGKYLELSEDKLLVMAEPEAKSYKSVIKVYTEEGEIFESELAVGKPVSVNGWKVYLTSYDTDKGKWSETCVVELVKDPWLWAVYTGLIMMVIGALYLIFTGKRK